MGKIISLFNHKGGVGKTTFTYNLGYALANKGKKVLLIDADSQINLTTSLYGFTEDESNDGRKKIDELPTYLQKYISIKDVIESAMSGSYCDKKVYTSEHCKNLDIISGSLVSYELDNQLSTLANTGGDGIKKIFDNIQKRFNSYTLDSKYDFVLIDTSPNAVSTLNAFLVGMSDYFIAPATPSFFSKQSITNLPSVFATWKEMLSKVIRHPNTPYGVDFKVKFLGICIQMAKKQNKRNNPEGISHAHYEWSQGVNDAIKPFFNIHKYCTQSDFESIFPQSKNPYIIKMCIDVAAELRSIADRCGKPVIGITQEDCMKYKNKRTKQITNITDKYITKVDKKTGNEKKELNHHYSAKKMITEQFDYIAKCFIENESKL